MKNGNDTITYEYDVNGNITKIQDNEGTSTYEYDEMNQMVRENNHILNKTVTYIYDVGGNLVTKREYAYTTQSLPTEPVKTVICTYDTKWKDKITSFDGKIFTYDEIGNPLSYGDISYEWLSLIHI